MEKISYKLSGYSVQMEMMALQVYCEVSLQELCFVCLSKLSLNKRSKPKLFYINKKIMCKDAVTNGSNNVCLIRSHHAFTIGVPDFIVSSCKRFLLNVFQLILHKINSYKINTGLRNKVGSHKSPAKPRRN